LGGGVCAKEASPYKLTIRPSAKRDLKKLKNNKLVLESIDRTINLLPSNPRPFGVENIGGNNYRVRDGEYRILYEVDDAARSIDIKRVRDRKDVYRH
jgi:mRNA interferase RelE/StbE